MFGFDADASAAWYETLEKPWFAPPSWIFGPVWTVLYVLIAVAFIRICIRIYKKELPRMILVPLSLNAVSNALFSPLQFGLRSNVLALIDILVVLGSLLWLLWSIRKSDKLSFALLVPYALWVSFATVLQISVTLLNL